MENDDKIERTQKQSGINFMIGMLVRLAWARSQPLQLHFADIPVVGVGSYAGFVGLSAHRHIM